MKGYHDSMKWMKRAASKQSLRLCHRSLVTGHCCDCVIINVVNPEFSQINLQQLPASCGKWAIDCIIISIWPMAALNLLILSPFTLCAEHKYVYFCFQKNLNGVWDGFIIWVHLLFERMIKELSFRSSHSLSTNKIVE